MIQGKDQLTTEELFTLRDALIHAEQVSAVAGRGALAQKYSILFRKLGAIIDQRSTDV